MQFDVLTGFTFLNNQTCYNEIFIFINKRSNNFLSMCFFLRLQFFGPILSTRSRQNYRAKVAFCARMLMIGLT